MLHVPTRALANVLRAPLFPVHAIARRRHVRPMWLHARIRPRLEQLERPLSPLTRFVPELARLQPTALETLRRLALAAGDDPGVAGVILEIPPLQTGWSGARGLRDIIRDLRSRGKEVVAFLPRGGGNIELYVASAASRVVLGPEASFAALGLAMETRYLRPLLDRVGVRVESFARKEFKTAAETLTRDSMSDPQREQLEALLRTLQGELESALAERPGVGRDGVSAIFERGFLRGEAAMELGVVDAHAYDDQLPEVVARLFPATVPARKRRSGLLRRSTPSSEAPETVSVFGARDYLDSVAADFFRPVLERSYIGVVNVSGTIRDNEEEPRGGAQTLWALREARRDRRCVGVILLINSPGGSALASDRIHREVVRAREKKPVVAFFEDVAASGGYYIAAPCDAIVAQPVSITGSIGVVSARLMAKELMERVGVRTEVLRGAPHADMFSPAREMEEAERRIIERELDDFYESFVRIVADGRKRDVPEIEALARGRVWSGRDAAARGLVDRLGGFEVAVEEIRRRTELPDRKREELEPRLIQPRTPVPPAPPVMASADGSDEIAGLRDAVIRGTVGAIAPGVVEHMDLARGSERVLFYAPHLPRID